MRETKEARQLRQRQVGTKDKENKNTFFKVTFYFFLKT